ncbi:MAG: phosphate acyltransferase PlsX [Bacteroidales bacterium]|nr:phosphate acyltransferase PlsX [Bacteroidales bacterium]
MRIGLDAMGGDFAPGAIIDGALLAISELPRDVHIVLIGDEQIIRSYLSEKGVNSHRFKIIHTTQVIEMGEKPLKAISSKPDSSISVGLRLLKSNKIDTFASAGNSGAMLVGSMYSVGAIPGVIRPTTFAHIPQENGGTSIILDIGTNTDVKVDVLYQFGLLGSIYAESVMKIAQPRIGLLNIGEEEGKGNLLTQSAFPMMKESKDFNFIGNIESRDLYKSKADVVVCDGFTGNILLKQIESFYRLLQKRNLLDNYFERFNYENYGGSPILGLNGTVILGHGISSSIAIKNMILLSRNIALAKLSDKVKQALFKYSN